MMRNTLPPLASNDLLGRAPKRLRTFGERQDAKQSRLPRQRQSRRSAKKLKPTSDANLKLPGCHSRIYPQPTCDTQPSLGARDRYQPEQLPRANEECLKEYDS